MLSLDKKWDPMGSDNFEKLGVKIFIPKEKGQIQLTVKWVNQNIIFTKEGAKSCQKQSYQKLENCQIKGLKKELSMVHYAYYI